MNFKKKSLFKIVLVTLFTLLVFISCKDDDNPVTPQETHKEFIGVVLENSGIRIASILRGVTTDTLVAIVDSLGDHIEVKFYDEDEHIVNAPEEEEFKLAWEIDNPNILEFFQHPGEEGEFEFHLKGKASGLTTIELFVNHNDHADFRSGKIPVKIK